MTFDRSVPDRWVPHTVTHATYRREPYVRFRTPELVIDGKAAAWTRVSVLLHWVDSTGHAHNRWVPAENVRRIARDESSWQDPYDDWSFYYPETPLIASASSSPGSSAGSSAGSPTRVSVDVLSAAA